MHLPPCDDLLMFIGYIATDLAREAISERPIALRHPNEDVEPSTVAAPAVEPSEPSESSVLDRFEESESAFPSKDAIAWRTLTMAGNVPDSKSSDGRKSDVDEDSVSSEEGASTRSNADSENSILDDDRGDIDYAQDDFCKSKEDDDRREEVGKSTQESFSGRARESEMTECANSPKEDVSSQPNKMQTIAATTGPASRSKRKQTEQVSSPKQQRCRPTAAELNNDAALRYLKDNRVCGNDFVGIVSSYNKKFGTRRSPDDLRKFYERQLQKEKKRMKEEERLMKRKWLVVFKLPPSRLRDIS